ncbi:uncharacterized protein ACHE_70159A [Aspergillus chevalieri]|uniref:Amine oxidase domain-containing protein n=1 Tax=Aspergillus chevalieri TaxID=182096 RepID=A0A7R7VV18_ASPCH|nr:uncharacterized protein ACHE_70159A [Aspergillus chevalieri]BCR91316.1 hypothetical protein ACHE_70159A [Aspergillus chevalieri]
MKSLAAFSSLATLTLAASQFDTSSYNPSDIITRDVAVIGGGSSGTFGAFKLKDRGKSVVVIESQGQLGGHIETYTDPATGATLDYGVHEFWNISLVTDFFARFNVPIEDFVFPSEPAIYADFKTGQVLSNFTVGSNFTAYIEQLDRYPDLAYGWDLTYPVADDLLLPFGDFITKYGLEAEAYNMFTLLPGVGNILEQSTVNIFKGITKILFDSEAGSSIAVTNTNNQLLYEKAQAALGTDALLNSTVINAQRPTDNSNCTLVVMTPTGNKLIVAKHILVTIPLLLDNMQSFGLDSDESSLFQQFNYTAWYPGLIRNTGLSFSNRYLNVGANTLYNIPELPGIYTLIPTKEDGVFLYWYGAQNALTESEVKDSITSSIKALGGVAPEFMVFGNHTPYELVVPVDAIKNGFYKDLNALQGYRNTWYTGGLFVGASGPLWNFTNTLVGQMTA